MSKVFQILNQHRSTQVDKPFRVWAGFGQLITLGPALSIQMHHEEIDGEWSLVATIFKESAFSCEVFLAPGSVLDLSAMAGIHMIPRAYEQNKNQQPDRVLLEFVAVTDGAREVLHGQA